MHLTGSMVTSGIEIHKPDGFAIRVYGAANLEIASASRLRSRPCAPGSRDRLLRSPTYTVRPSYAVGAGLAWEEGSADTTELELTFLRETLGPLAAGQGGYRRPCPQAAGRHVRLRVA